MNADRIERVRERMKLAADRAGRNGDEITLVAVSKGRSTSEIRAAHALGLRHFGENYWQEAHPKVIELRPLDLKWHFIGGLQSNKAKFVVDQVQLIHSIDRESLVREMVKAHKPWNPPQKCLIQVNVDGEESKGGCQPADLPRLIEFFQQSPGVQLSGLMTFPGPDDLVKARKCFAALRELAYKHAPSLNAPHGLTELSMGTSGDFEMAIEEGATIVRIGTDLFGERSTGV